MRTIASITIAIVLAIALGLVMMLFPVMTYRFFVTTKNTQEWRGGGTDLGQQTKEESYKITPAPMAMETVREAAQAYGRMDAGTAPLLSTLVSVALLAVAGLAVALGVSFCFKRRVRLF